MQVGELSARTGASIRSLRYYEQVGLLAAQRRANGYRDFGAAATERVQAIRALLASGFTIEEIRSLAGCLQGAPDDLACNARTAKLYRSKLAAIDARLHALTELRARLCARLEQLEPARARDTRGGA
jgi:DNA-binding transcriptional MerR regulator